MANTCTVNDGGRVSLGNKTMLIGVVTFTDGAATEVTVNQLNKVEWVSLEENSGSNVDGYTFTTSSFKANTAASGDTQHAQIIGY